MQFLVSVWYSLIVLPSLSALLSIGRLWDTKLRKRKTAVDRLNSKLLVATNAASADNPARGQITADDIDTTQNNANVRPVVAWFHAASMGEFEQLVPVIARFKQTTPQATIVVSVFSVSGLPSAESHPDVDAVFVLPVDTVRNVRRCIDAVRPTVFIVNRYDLWPNLISELHRRNTPIFLVNATAPSAARNRLLRPWIASVYRKCTEIMAVTEDHAQQLRDLVGSTKHGPHVHVIPDTRIDRILQRIATPDQRILDYRSSICTVVIGSSWTAEETMIADALALVKQHSETSGNSNSRSNALHDLRLIIVPHEPKPPTVSHLCDVFNATPFSQATPSTPGHLVVDSVGLLLSLYAIADAAFVGGGFGDGVHSVLEPSVYGMPVACGPFIQRSPDAQRLASAGVLQVVNNAHELADWLGDVVLDADRRAMVARSTQLCARHGEYSSDAVAQRIALMIQPSAQHTQ